MELVEGNFIVWRQACKEILEIGSIHKHSGMHQNCQGNYWTDEWSK